MVIPDDVLHPSSDDDFSFSLVDASFEFGLAFTASIMNRDMYHVYQDWYQRIWAHWEVRHMKCSFCFVFWVRRRISLLLVPSRVKSKGLYPLDGAIISAVECTAYQ